MPIAIRLLLCALLTAMLTGCIAAVIPLAAAGALGKTQVDKMRARAGLISSDAKDLEPNVTLGNTTYADSTLGTPGAEIGAGTGAQSGAQSGTIKLPSADDDLQLSDIVAEPKARNIGAGNAYFDNVYQRFLSMSLERRALLEDKDFDQSAILVPRVSLVSPKSMACTGLPSAVIIDIDRGSSDKAPNEPFLFSAPGLSPVLDQLRAEKIAIIWLSARPAAQALDIIQHLKSENLLRDGVSDFVSLNRSADDRKQLRRWAAAEIYCILGIVGDARGDFDELYDYLLDPDYAVALERNFGNGWFLLNEGFGAYGRDGKTPPDDPLVQKTRSDFFDLKPQDTAASPDTADKRLAQTPPSPDKKEDQ